METRKSERESEQEIETREGRERQTEKMRLKSDTKYKIIWYFGEQ
jgi:hypothetical protein